MKSNMTVNQKKAVVAKMANEILQMWKRGKLPHPIDAKSMRHHYLNDDEVLRDKACALANPYRSKVKSIKKIEPISLKGRNGGYKGVRVIYEDGSVVEELE
jgi:hypothetical protein